MDVNRNLIILKGKDKTKEVRSFFGFAGKTIIFFESDEKEYKYYDQNVVIRTNPEIVKIKGKQLYHLRIPLYNVDKSLKFRDKTKVFFNDGSTKIYNSVDITIGPQEVNISDLDVVKCFKEISKYTNDKQLGEKYESNNKGPFLYREYQKLNFVHPDSILKKYIKKEKLKKEKDKDFSSLIYPFKFNASQKEAIDNVFKKDMSIIQGPPGTGKTQTILNIIANLIMNGKTVAVVSGNNEAVKNVKEKLEKHKLDFILANLGNKDNIKDFFENIIEPSFWNWKINDNIEDIKKQISKMNHEMDHLLVQNNEKAKLQRELSAYVLEQKYFEEYHKHQNIEEQKLVLPVYKTPKKIISFLADNELAFKDNTSQNLIYKIKMIMKYGIMDTTIFGMDEIIQLQKIYYEYKIRDLEKQIKQIEKDLEKHSFEELQRKHQEYSMQVFKNELFNKYKYKGKTEYTSKNYKDKFNQFMNRFPVVLSTTHSLRNCIQEGYLFDYLIIDEASQVDLLTGSLALSCTKNVIIVGDMKQLPQIVDENIKKKILMDSKEEVFDYFLHNILSSILKMYGDEIPMKTLKEHYRCHPKIIEFCNQRYYDNELIAFANKEHLNQKSPIKLYYTEKR